MRRLIILIATLVLTPSLLLAYQSVFPTGTTVFHPDKTWTGYTVFEIRGEGETEGGTALIDMNGNLVKHWTEVVAAPVRILPGGYVVGGSNRRRGSQEALEIVQVDWDGEIVWKFDRTELVEEEGEEPRWMVRMHHDWQREGSPVGYYAPGAEPMVDEGRTLILAHRNVLKPEITDKLLEDDYILEVTWDGDITWEWMASDHVDEFGFSGEARNTIYRYPGWNAARGSADWMHLNAMSYVGPNHWYDGGDERFHPENVMWSSRQANIIAIVDRAGDVVWKMGPDYRDTPALAELGQIVGQHHPHIIPKGLPGAGNLLVFDNGGAAGYGAPNPSAPTGRGVVRRLGSRVLEVNPVTFEKVWEYSIAGQERVTFFSQYISAAQRLPNGNTLITEGAIGRIFEVTTDSEIVWEYVNPYFTTGPNRSNRVYRAYRVPYDWVPQLERPTETAVIPPPNEEFRVTSQE